MSTASAGSVQQSDSATVSMSHVGHGLPATPFVPLQGLIGHLGQPMMSASPQGGQMIAGQQGGQMAMGQPMMMGQQGGQMAMGQPMKVMGGQQAPWQMQPPQMQTAVPQISQMYPPPGAVMYNNGQGGMVIMVRLGDC